LFNDVDLQNSFTRSIEQIKIESEELKRIYESFFDFNIILTSDTGSKTAVNRDYIYESNQNLKETTANINAIFDEMFLGFKKYILNNLPKDKKDELNISTFIFDNVEFLNRLNTLNIQKDFKKTVKNILYIKDKLYTLKYILSSSSTLSVTKKLNKLTVNELQDSKTIFTIIDHLGMVTNSFYDFYNRVQSFEEDYFDEVDLDLNFFDSLVVSESEKISEFIYNNKKNKFFLDFRNLSKVHGNYLVNRVYIENVISALIEQACLEMIKKERYSTKSDRTILLKVDINKKILSISCIFDGLYSNSTEENLTGIDPDRNLILVKNLLFYVNGDFHKIDKGSSIEYKVNIKLNKNFKTEVVE